MDPQDLVTVYTVSNAIEAEIVKNALESEGIRCFIGGSHQAAEAGLTGIAVTLAVPALDADRARKFLAAHDHHRKHQQN